MHIPPRVRGVSAGMGSTGGVAKRSGVGLLGSCCWSTEDSFEEVFSASSAMFLSKKHFELGKNLKGDLPICKAR